MGAPRSFRNVRVSVRTKSEAVDASWRTPFKSFTHARYQRINLYPVSTSELLAYQRLERDVQWRATADSRPVITEGSRLVLLADDGSTTSMVLDVVHVVPTASKQIVFCAETSEVQS